MRGVFVDEKLHLLVELQKLDSNILTLRLKIDSMPSHIAAEEAPYKEAAKAFETARQQQLSLEKKKKDKERLIEDLTEKIRKLKARSSETKTNKEYQANLKEAEAAEADNARLAEAKAGVESLNKEKEKEIRFIEQELLSLKEKRKQLSEKIEPDLYKLYMNLLKSGRGLAVAEAKKERCGGCNMNIPPQLFVELKLGGTIFQCPQCRRILFYEKPALENNETAGRN